jgi:hypothetical protein
MKIPKVIQTVFHDQDGSDIAHDYYLNATWIINLCERSGSRAMQPYITKAIESKRRRCVERYGEEWGKEPVNQKKNARLRGKKELQR